MKRLIVLGLAAVLVASLITVVLSSRGPRDERGTLVPTTYSSGRAGARGLYLLLEELGYAVSRSRSPLVTRTQRDVLWTLASTPLSDAEKNALARSIDEGATVVATAGPVCALLETQGLSGCKVVTMTSLTVGEASIAVEPFEGLSGAPEPTQKWASSSEGDPVVASWSHGKGRVVLFAPLDLLSNAQLRRLDAARLVLDVASALGHEHVFDESRTGFGETSIGALLLRAPWRFGAAQLVLAIFVTLAILSRRSAPITLERDDRRREGQAHVDAVAGLWARHGDATLPLESLLRALEARAVAAGARAVREPAFVAWTRWRSAPHGDEAASLWTRAQGLGPTQRTEVVKVAARLRAIEAVVFRNGSEEVLRAG